MAKALLKLLSNRAVRAMITELCVGVAVGVVTTLHRRNSNEKSKRVLLHLQKGSSDGRYDGPEEEMRHEDKRGSFKEERKIWGRERSYTRDYM